MDRICIFKLLLNPNKIDALLTLLVTGYEKWVTYNNVNRHRSGSNRTTLANSDQARVDSLACFAMCLVVLAENYLLWATPGHTNR